MSETAQVGGENRSAELSEYVHQPKVGLACPSRNNRERSTKYRQHYRWKVSAILMLSCVQNLSCIDEIRTSITFPMFTGYTVMFYKCVCTNL